MEGEQDMKKRVLAIFMALVLAAGLTGCSSNNASETTSSKQEETTKQAQTEGKDETTAATTAASGEALELSITWWGSQTRADLTQEALTLYESLNPGVTFDGQFLSGADYWNKLATSAAGHTMADVIQMDKAYIQQYVDNGMLVDLQPYVDSGVIDLSNVDPSVQEFGRIGDGLYAICIGVNSPALFYNKTLLDENSIEVKDNMTMDEFLEICRQVYEKTGYKTNLQYNNGTSWMDFYLRSFGEATFADGKIGASEESIASFFNLYKMGIEEGWLVDPSVFAERTIGQPEQEPLVYGSDPSNMSWCAFYFSNNMASITNAAPEGMEIGITTWPSDDAVKSNFLKPSMFFSVSVDSEHPEDAAKLIDFWTNSVDCNKILLGERGVPVSSVVADAIAADMSATDQMVVEYINNVVTPKCSAMSPASPNGATEVYDLVYKLEEKVCYQEMTPEDAAKELMTQGNKILESKQ
jgi:multiple sugar transport system substrate-binding protein